MWVHTLIHVVAYARVCTHINLDVLISARLRKICVREPRLESAALFETSAPNLAEEPSLRHNSSTLAHTSTLPVGKDMMQFMWVLIHVVA